MGSRKRGPDRFVSPDDIRKLAAIGKTRREIATQLGFNYSHLCKIAIREGIEIMRDPNFGVNRYITSMSEFWTQNGDRLEALVEEGATASEVAGELGTTKNAVIGRAARLGLTWQRSPATVHKTPRIEFPRSGCCVFPHGDVGDDGFFFCGAPTAKLLMPYCDAHLRKCYRPATNIAIKDSEVCSLLRRSA